MRVDRHNTLSVCFAYTQSANRLPSLHSPHNWLSIQLYLHSSLRNYVMLQHQKRHDNKKSQHNLGRASSPPFTAENNYATKSPLVTIGCPHIHPQNCPFPWKGSNPLWEGVFSETGDMNPTHAAGTAFITEKGDMTCGNNAASC